MHFCAKDLSSPFDINAIKRWSVHLRNSHGSLSPPLKIVTMLLGGKPFSKCQEALTCQMKIKAFLHIISQSHFEHEWAKDECNGPHQWNSWFTFRDKMENKYLTGEMNMLLTSNGLNKSTFSLLPYSRLACSCSCMLNWITRNEISSWSKII